MSKLDKALDIDLAERAEQLSKEAERLRSNDKAVPNKVDDSTDKLDEAVVTSVQKLRKLAER